MSPKIWSAISLKRGSPLPGKKYHLRDAFNRDYESDVPGALGGHRGGKIYGRLDCASALRAIAKGGYVENRVFFADEKTALRAGYRPCGCCMKADYREWKEDPARFRGRRLVP